MDDKVRIILPPVWQTVFGAPACTDINKLSADIAFLGFPYEQGHVCNLPSGKMWGPKGVREQVKGYQYSGYYGGVPLVEMEDEGKGAAGWFDPDSNEWKLRGVTMADCGDVNVLPAEGGNVNKETNCDRLTKAVKKIIDRGAFPVVIGGDHTLAFPIARALDKFEPVDIIHFDAHTDFWDSNGGAKINDSDCIIRCSELPFIQSMTSIGLNPRQRMDPSSKDAYDAMLNYGANIFTPKKLRQVGIRKLLDNIPKGKNIYITLDIDCLDSPQSPGMSGQEYGGLTFLEVSEIIMSIPLIGNVVAFDLNGLIPARDPSGITGRLVSNLIEDFLSARFPSKY